MMHNDEITKRAEEYLEICPDIVSSHERMKLAILQAYAKGFYDGQKSLRDLAAAIVAMKPVRKRKAGK